MRSTPVGVPMKYRPPVSFEVSSTVHVVSEVLTPAVRKHPSCTSCSTFSNRGAETIHIFRQSLIGTTAPFLSRRGCVKSSITWYIVLLSPSVNKRLEPLPAPNRHAAEHTPMSQEDAGQIPELPVPRGNAAGEDEGDRDATGARAAGPGRRVNHAALVRTESAGNGSARRVDDVREHLRHVPSLRLPGLERTTRVAPTLINATLAVSKFVRTPATVVCSSLAPVRSIQMPSAAEKPAALCTSRLASPHILRSSASIRDYIFFVATGRIRSCFPNIFGPRCAKPITSCWKKVGVTAPYLALRGSGQMDFP